MQYSNGDEYNGEWSGGYAKGIGVMLYRNGDKYEGEWAENKRNGKGSIDINYRHSILCKQRSL